MRNRKGFTLLEILVALAILSGTLVVAFRISSDGIAMQARSEGWLKATLLGEAEIRKSLTTFPGTGESEGKFDAPDDRYRWQLNVTQALHEDAREVHLTVVWTENGTDERILLSGLAVR
ncbi:MAG TPA: prepilin-type N-terminal cleavage/methylation domain-containing protein [Candidatus Deferrimicrobiaceae bacterium]|jgi:prepilin-type N-terminal cleavage/methylation domain-containing protein